MSYQIDHLRRIWDENAPCDDCAHRKACKEQEIACRAFSSYIVNGTYLASTPRNPTCGLYNKIFDENDEKALKEYLRQFQDGQDDLFDMVADKTLK